MANRHLSRSIVLQSLFEWDLGNPKETDIKETIKRNVKEFALGIEDDAFVYALAEEVMKRRKAVDEIIIKAAPDWPIEKISVVDRNILRIGLTELLFGDRKEVPPKVAINEAIELGKTFGGENSGKFINGVLGAVYKEMGEPDKEQTGKKKGTKNENGTADPANLPEERLGGALVYSRHEGEIYLGLVHDVFGYWTFSKGKLKTDGNVEKETVQKIKQEIGLDVVIKEKLGENEYVASHPEHGKTLKKVAYFLAESEYKDLVLEKSGGLDAARWFPLSAIPELRVYNDIIPLITKAVEILSGKKL
ncbi:transcription antitermination factor NusB [Candidatus Nomurabacteria bacterium RIFCSPHIGHO2_02_FULL_41_18]|uniref:Transcription antitermination protein NusB n=1 Tax=Candidatus Nomurabacteria bacterium RIFCSPHIGHO2_02_FULL_41_18 TaxID=1801754 RepID=A0A1F6W7H8_9BACT|nr:MAG: transcription antitermination factor NusB [Candidatus Nomurabacteria bacterium RIFCSPHIGHO2_01_FULL_41_71]OGI77841.1 MAG: transcription antitermination factor NusB [Candidatus Nomurabacteria bacterium RIFCSPHIGHO2_02_FULL_41_18]OGI89991.1 MAG: transcription antitermination factor NusB [Candidatus Nomurabacteria bacterium RIFCSPLOWO2_01_FULL_41_52b]OGJ00138.1 MAG: transcription antitermination factor NusB [Candidatus Nomurabacteria bacterium RIFCSPLOWO2_02_FULL_41_9]